MDQATDLCETNETAEMAVSSSETRLTGDTRISYDYSGEIFTDTGKNSFFFSLSLFLSLSLTDESNAGSQSRRNCLKKWKLIQALKKTTRMTKLRPMALNGNLLNGSQPTPTPATPNKINRTKSNVNHIFLFYFCLS